MSRARWTSMLCLVAVCTLSACLWPRDIGEASTVRGQPAAAPGDMAALIAEYSADERSVRQFEYIPFSEARLAHEDALADRWTERLDELDWDALDRDGRIDWLLLGNHLEHERRQREALRHRRQVCINRVISQQSTLLRFRRPCPRYDDPSMPAVCYRRPRACASLFWIDARSRRQPLQPIRGSSGS